MIIAGSRYAGAVTETVDKSGQDVSVIVPGIPQAFSFSYVSYLVLAGDRIDNLAYQFYGDASQWWQIANANPSIMFWDNLEAGSVIRIPVGR